MRLTAQNLRAAIAGGAVYFDANLNPVEPQVGQWFCELDIVTEDGDEIIEGGALVEFLGADTQYVWSQAEQDFVGIQRHLVCDESAEDARAPHGVALMLQA